MKKMFVYIMAFLFAGQLQAQASLDMIVLKNRKNRTKKTFFSGIPITFQDKTGQLYSGKIKKVAKDSFFIQQYDIRAVGTMWGTQVQDTISSYLVKFHTNEVAWVVKPRTSFELFKNGSLMMIGGAGYGVLHAVNALYLGEPVLWSNMAIAGGAVAAGYALRKMRNNRYVIGRKYKLVYINATPSK